MSNLLGRVCKVTLHRQRTTGFVGDHPEYFEEVGNGVEITRQRMKFKIEKTLEAEPNKCEITIVNLAEKSRNEFKTLPVRVRIEAGYDDTYRLLFVGDVRKGSGSTLEGTNWETRLLVGDGSRAYANARVSRSYKSGTAVTTVLRDAARSLGLELPRDIASAPALQAALATGETIHGWAADELTRLLAPYGYSWSIQGGRLQVLLDGAVREHTTREISEATGMIGSPKMGTADKTGKPVPLTVTMKLYPEVTPGERIRLISREYTGLYKVSTVKHEGDTGGTVWDTEIEVLPL